MAEKLSGWRTIISLGISLVLKLFVLKGIVGPTAADPHQVDLATDAVMLAASGVADLSAMWFRLRATKPGALATKEAP